MQDVADQSAAPTTIGADLCAIFVSLELSRSTWLAPAIVIGNANPSRLAATPTARTGHRRGPGRKVAREVL
jgi:hypothetical protein